MGVSITMLVEGVLLIFSSIVVEECSKSSEFESWTSVVPVETLESVSSVIAFIATDGCDNNSSTLKLDGFKGVRYTAN